ncbi:MAG: hypothetical protein ACYC9I_11505 [Desulfuromonadales bacterium]
MNCVCGWRGNWRSGTWMQGVQISDQQALLVIFARRLGANSKDIASILGERPATVKCWVERLRALGAHDAMQSAGSGGADS